MSAAQVIRWPRGRNAALLGLLCAALAVAPLRAGVPALPGPPSPPPQLTLPVAIRFALENNPELAALRQQHGIAAAAVVIARTYPFNPTWEDRIQANGGPASAGIDNRVSLEELLLWEVEVRGQGTYRRQQAVAALSRTDWEIASQEQLLAARVIRAYDTVLYRQAKLRLLDETVRLDESLLQRVRVLFKAGKAKAADQITADTELADARSLVGPGRTMLTTAEAELSRSLGVVDGAFALQGALERPAVTADAAAVTRVALERRADLRAHQVAEQEADAALALAVANRFGNPVVGPAFSYNETRVHFIGAQVNVPLPVFNRAQGDIRQREAQRALAVLQTRQFEVQVRQDVEAALARLGRARATVDVYRTQVLPKLESGVTDIKSLYESSEAGVDLLAVIDVQRKLLRARDGSIDAQFEVSQAEADLAAAVGDPAVVLALCPPTAAAAPLPEPVNLPSMPPIQLSPRPGHR